MTIKFFIFSSELSLEPQIFILYPIACFMSPLGAFSRLFKIHMPKGTF